MPDASDPGDLPRRLEVRLEELDGPAPGDDVVVAVSGGVDSLVLLHLLRFPLRRLRLGLTAAHLDHRMRPGSGADARWLRGLLRAWRVKGRFRRLPEVPSDEAGARRARYAFLDEVRVHEGARWILTAHHADDQAETVLFRALRGTGLPGLRGIPARREPGVLRPLLRFWKEELAAYAAARSVRPRLDPTNVDTRWARNVVRHEILPRAEEAVAPGARRALVRLGRLAEENEAAWESLLPELLERVVVEAGGSGGEGPIVLDRPALLAHHPGVRARLLRTLLERFGERMDEAGTREAVEFTRSGGSGRRLQLPGDVVLARDFDRLVLRRDREEAPDATLAVVQPGSGDGEFRVGGRRYRARWSPGRAPAGEWVEGFSPSQLRFPLRLRGWTPGDRIRLSYGSKKLKKLFGEHRVPRRRRHRWPVLVDARDRVLWLPGLARSTLAVPEDDERPLFIGISDADSL